MEIADQTTTNSVEQGGNGLDDISRAVNQTVTTKTDKEVLQLALQFLKRKPSAHDRDTLLRKSTQGSKGSGIFFHF